MIVIIVFVVGVAVVSVKVLVVALIAICLPVGSNRANFMAFACKQQILKFSLDFSLSFLLLPFSFSLFHLAFADFAAVILKLIILCSDELNSFFLPLPNMAYA